MIEQLVPHQVQHSIASNLIDAGRGIHEVAERLGHDAATLIRCYVCVDAARRLQVAHEIADLVAPPTRHLAA
ncbi:hypothetical protein GCM10010112_72960 [Actinoplanes lobatus]|uniref:Site-specific recombinase XerD n=1 Tax=Actinoplanes lobatus TaxID=113568 RepID=A0A7W7HR97_9ACTN|nr:hypothetical protein [Actinoplanes lobatus]MBB4755185.1 site-specific recombinase XerD [Actinoplanes lobatus]GGN88974.1 hypothetical protein GCM10010112_72960 [Actinoplanes lobatus]GIE43390.1 hypothetical protein Alo02nite_62880 [Actinoplanes lobatus]